MPITERTRLCTSCRRPLPEPPAPPACTECGAVHVAHHSTWPSVLKWWLMWEYVRARFLPWLSEQEVWEELLADSLNGVRAGAAHPNPDGFTLSSRAVDLYPVAVQRAQAWRAAGSPITPAIPTHDDRRLSRAG